VPDMTGPLGRDDLVERLASATEGVARRGNLDAALLVLLEAGTAAVGAVAGVVYLHDPDRAAAEVVAALGSDAPAAGPIDPAEPALEVIRTRAENADRRDADGTAHVDLPLVVVREGVEEAVGALSFRYPAEASAAPIDLVVLRALADLAAIAVDRARLASLVAERSEWYERMAHSDPLTGLANQRTFGRVLELELARAGRQGGEVSIAVFDIDGFVETNETAGREVGDDVLRAFAVVLNESVRLVDTVARYGGDEFVLVAPGSAGTTVANRVLSGVAALEPVGGRPISVSAGVARFPADGTTAEELMEAALAALQGAREQGPGTMTEASAQRTG
jgi:diguanylate cyclase (GGDEF)-like protein